tara:strand:+ start:886 stop:1002 length:117 start_codon:yes stop_codon:yes gene_type:complete
MKYSSNTSNISDVKEDEKKMDSIQENTENLTNDKPESI